MLSFNIFDRFYNVKTHLRKWRRRKLWRWRIRRRRLRWKQKKVANVC